MLSLLRLQREQIFSTAIPLNQRFCIVGRAFVQALHAKILIFARRFRCQSFLQRGALTSPEQLSPTAWFVWYNRNQVIHKANFSLALQIWESAQRLVQDFINVNSNSPQHIFPSQLRWTTPPCGIFKVNVDGAIIRNSEGLVISAMSKTLPARSSMEEVEAIALENGVLPTQEMNLTDIIVESDSLSVVQSIQKEIYGALGHIIQGTLSALSTFRSWKIQRLKRESNRAAHELAHLARASGVTQIWKGMDLPCIQFLLR